ncbi:MAG: hypothetical protein EPO32_12505 [Anaerolineae bacterium]|nr:MAG: hypothetical protein EPO32_12505 [Anaerolineae bacterium]
MNTAPRRPVQLYRALLAAYPREFRGEYGAAMQQLFVDQYRRARTPGERTALWLRTLADTAMAAISEWLKAWRTAPPAARLVRAAGILFIIGGIFVPLAWWLGTLRPSFDYPYRYQPFVQDVLAPALFMAALTAFTGGAICLLLGMWPAANGHQRLALLSSALGSTASIVGWGALGLQLGDSWWSFAMGGLTLFFLGVLWAGLAADARNPLPHAPGAWVLAGLWIPVSALAGAVYEMVTGRWLDGPDWVFGLALMLTSLGMLWVGRGLAQMPVQAARAQDGGDA